MSRWAARTSSYDLTDPRGYIYGNVNIPSPVVWTLGLSADDYKEESNEAEKINPKLGVQWNVTDDIRLRAAAFQVVKGPLSTNRTLEPTQVAGFNQFFDDDAGTVARRFGIGSDWQPARQPLRRRRGDLARSRRSVFRRRFNPGK